MASPPGQALLSRSSSDSSMCCCDAGLLSGAFAPASGCGSNPFADCRQQESWAPVHALSLSGDADEDVTATLWNTDRDTSIADALLRRLLTGETGTGGRSGFVQRPQRMTGAVSQHLDLFPRPSISLLNISDGAAGVSGAPSDGAAVSGWSRQGSAAPSTALTLGLTPPISAFATRGQGDYGGSSRSKTCALCLRVFVPS